MAKTTAQSQDKEKKELVKIPSGAVTRIEFDDAQMQLIRDQVAPKATQNEFLLFVYQCKRTGLDPLTKQIYCIHRGGKMTVQTAIDGFRVIAERSSLYAGQDKPVFIHDENGGMIGCEVTVYKFNPHTHERYPAAVGVAFWGEYCPSPGQDTMWKKMPRTMISKVAEALALRKAFPQDLSGVYTEDEMDQAGFVPADEKTEDTTATDIKTVSPEVKLNAEKPFIYTAEMKEALRLLLSSSTFKVESVEYKGVLKTIELPALAKTTYERLETGLKANQAAVAAA